MADGRGICNVKECTNEIKYLKLQLCEKHYGRYKRHGDAKYTITENHGLRDTPEYRIWASMKDRCTNSSTEGYSRYGGRGIKICSVWFKSFISFYEDMGPRPSPKHSLDRIDNEFGNYSCGHCEECIENGWKFNCRWATAKEQANNRRSTVMLTHNGETMSMSQWAEKLNVNRGLIHHRLSRGWSVQATLTMPVKTCMQRFRAHPTTKKVAKDT